MDIEQREDLRLPVADENHLIAIFLIRKYRACIDFLYWRTKSDATKGAGFWVVKV